MMLLDTLPARLELRDLGDSSVLPSISDTAGELVIGED